MTKLKVQIDGFNLSRVIDLLVFEGVCVDNLKTYSSKIIFEINEKDELKLKTVCRRFHKKYKVVYKNVFKNIVRKIPLYFGSILAFIISFCFIFSYNQFIFKIDLRYESSTNFDLTQIENLLKNNGVKVGMKKSDVNINEIQTSILKTQGNIAGCSVSKNGGKLDIVVYPSVQKIEKQQEDIISKYDAIVSKIEIFAGKTGLKVGDLVKQGDVLIENDNGADGKIFGKVYYSDYVLFNENQVRKIETGKFENYFEFSLFGFSFLKTNKKSSFNNFVIEKNDSYLNKNAFLPVKYTKYVCKEIINQDIFVPFESKENEIKKELEYKVKEKIEDKNTITNTTFSVVRENNLIRIDCFVECEIDLIK